MIDAVWRRSDHDHGDLGFTSHFTAAAEFAFNWDKHDGKVCDGAPGASQPDNTDPSSGWWIATLIDSAAPVPMENWSWTYKSCNEQWINIEETNANEDGGNITGAVPCPNRLLPRRHRPVTAAWPRPVPTSRASLLPAARRCSSAPQ